MKRLIFIAALFFFMVGCDTANNVPDPTNSYFVKYFGTDGDQEGADMFVNDDGTILLLGTSTFSTGIGQAYLVKIGDRGDIIWEKFYSASGSLMAMDIEPIVNGNFVILCNVEDPASGINTFILTIDQNGNEINSGSFSYAGISNEIGITVTPIVDGNLPAGFLVSGNTNYDPIPNDNSDNGFEKISALLMRFNEDCSLYQGAWNDHQSSNGEDYFTKAVQVADLNNDDPFVLFGYTNSYPNNPSFNFWSTRINNNGGGLLLENGIIAGSPTNTDEKLGSVATINVSSQYKNYLLVGISTSNSGADNIFIATSQLSLLTTPKSITEFDLGNISALGSRFLEKVTSYPVNDGFVIAANTVADGNSNIILTKIRSDGQPIWNSPVILGGAGQDYESSVYVTADNKILVFGTMSIGDDGQKKMMLVKLNEDGQFK